MSRGTLRYASLCGTKGWFREARNKSPSSAEPGVSALWSPGWPGHLWFWMRAMGKVMSLWLCTFGQLNNRKKGNTTSILFLTGGISKSKSLQISGLLRGKFLWRQKGPIQWTISCHIAHFRRENLLDTETYKSISNKKKDNVRTIGAKMQE